VKKIALLSASVGSLFLGLGVLASSTALQACSTTTSGPTGFAEAVDGGNDTDAIAPGLGMEKSGEEAGIVGEGCGGGEVTPTKVPVYFQLVADGSGSMSGAKWEGQVEALKAVAQNVKEKSEAEIAATGQTDTALGLIGFEDSKDITGGSGPYPSASDIPLQAVANNQVMADFWGRVSGKTGGGTPTKTALTGAYSALEAYVPAANVRPNGKRVVILLSDGEPSDDNPMGSIHALAAAKTTQAKAIYTYAIGVGKAGGGYDPEFMALLAKAGKTAPSGCNPALTTNPDCFYQIDPSGGKSATQISTEMIAALEAIRALASECDLALVLVDKDGNRADPKKVEVTYVDDKGVEKPIAPDAANGWTYDDPMNPTRLILNGAACVQARSSSKGKTKVKMGCKVGGG
jgi:uncharacterized protein YegL